MGWFWGWGGAWCDPDWCRVDSAGYSRLKNGGRMKGGNMGTKLFRTDGV